MKSKILMKLMELGYEAYVVGGAVRDELLGIASRDIDITCRIKEEELRSIFTRVVAIGREEQSFLVSFKGERAELTLMTNRSIEDDLKRRDFTVNAIAAAGDVLIDPFNGQHALNEGRLSHVTPQSFVQDPIRLLRAVRMEQKLDLTMDKATLTAFIENRMLLYTASKERILQELLKLRSDIKNPARVVELLAMLEFTVSNEFAPHLLTIAKRSEAAFLAVLMTDKRRLSVLPKKRRQEVVRYHTYIKRPPSKMELLSLQREEVSDVSFLRDLRGLKDNLLEQYERLPIKHTSALCVTGHELIQVGVQQGPKIAQVKQELLCRIVNGELMNEKELLLRFVKQEMIT